jgi:hypothetical protein
MKEDSVNSSSQRPFVVWLLIILQGLLGIGALVSGELLMDAPDGSLLHMPLSVMHGSPFSDFFLPGMILFVFVGSIPALVAYGLWVRPEWDWTEKLNPLQPYYWAWTGSLVTPVIVFVWLTVELMWVHIGFLHYLYYSWAALILLITLLPVTRKFYKKK